MPNFDLANLLTVLARLDSPPQLHDVFFAMNSAVRRDYAAAAGAIRALMAERDAASSMAEAMTELAKPGATSAMVDVDRTVMVAVAAEREACAKVCEGAAHKSRGIVHPIIADGFKEGCVQQAEWCAANIRARGRS